MDTTNQTTPSNANFNGEQSGQENIIPILSKEVGGELAKGDSDSKNLQVVEDVSGQYPSTPFPKVEKMVDAITPMLTGLTLSEIEMILDKVKNRCYLYPILIAS